MSPRLAASQRLAHLVHRAVLAAMLAIAAYGGVSAVRAEPAPAPSSATDANGLVVRYLAAWNERDPKRRRELIDKTWADTGSYIDAHRHGEGHAAIDAMIKTAQDRFIGYQLRLVSGIETHHGFVRFSWSAGGTPDAPLYLAGTDVFVVASDGRLQQVIGFVDASPAH